MIESLTPPALPGRAARLLRGRLLPGLLVATLLVLGAVWPALARAAESGQLVVRSDGFIFWLQDGQRHVVYPASLGDDQINALPESVPLGASLAPALGQGPGISGQLVVRSDGYIFWIQGGERHVVYPTPLPDDQINALPESVPLNGALQPGPQPPIDDALALPGTRRSVRLPLGQACGCFIIRGTGQRSDVQIQVSDVQWDAWSKLKSTNPSNQLPRDGYEYVLVTVNAKYVAGPRDLPISLDRFDFSLVDSNDALYTPAFVVEPRPLVGMTAYPGSEITGSVAFQVPRGDHNLVLVWRYNSDQPFWFAIS